MHTRFLHHSHIPEKANRVLYLILIAFILIILRIWTLTVIQYESKLEESLKPQKRIKVEPSKRGTIVDRFGVPLALNKIQYNAAILYSQIKSIPSWKWVSNAEGKRVKVYKRREYIKELAALLAAELNLDAARLEDLIHAKAALYFNIPFVIKEDLTEKEYYRLKMLEREWLGIHVHALPKRFYPQGKKAGDIIGYIGAINREEFEAIISEMQFLQEFVDKEESGEDAEIPEGYANSYEVRQRLKTLQDLAYHRNDYVGKAGIESFFEEELRGIQGKRSFYSDARGNFLRELPGGYAATSGKQLTLALSLELQEYAELLLTQNERIREAKISQENAEQLSHKQPWIKGGAIIAMDPHTGQLLAMASYPRIDSNDFILSGNAENNAKKRSNIVRWYESEEYLAEIWDQKRPLEKELYDDHNEKYFEEEQTLTWEKYLQLLLPEKSALIQVLTQLGNIKNSATLQQQIETLLTYSGQNNLYWLFNTLYSQEPHIPYGPKVPLEVQQAIEENLEMRHGEVAKIRQEIDAYFQALPLNFDKVLLVDLTYLVLNVEDFSEAVLPHVGMHTLSEHRHASAALSSLTPFVKNLAKQIFREDQFKKWRQLHEKEFLKKKREEEQQQKRYTKPYTDYLDQEENQLFSAFWNAHSKELLLSFLLGESASDTQLEPYTKELILWQKEISQGAHAALHWAPAYKLLQKQISVLPIALRKEYLKTLRCFFDLEQPLYGKYAHVRKSQGKQLEKHLAMAFYPLHGYGYGRSHAYRQSTTQGSLFKLVTAYAGLSQRYQEVGNKKIDQHSLNPLEMNDFVHRTSKEWSVGYFKDGTSIPQHYKGGKIPKSQIKNIGPLNLVKALETSSNAYFALLAGDYLHSPNQLVEAAELFSFGKKTGLELPGEIRGKLPQDLMTNRTGLYSFAIGQHSLVVSPLQTTVMLSAIANAGKVLKPQILLATAPEVKNQIPLPHEIREVLLEGMRHVVERMHQSSLSSLSRFYQDYPEAISDYVEVEKELIGKTSTAEVMERIDLDLLQGTNRYTHVWFGGIGLDPETKDPELVVVVYLKYGKFGKEAAPLAAQMIKKWREIKKSKDLPQSHREQ